MEKNLDYYRGLPYTRRAEKRLDEDTPYWIAWIEELPGCKTDGSTCVEAMANLDVAFDDYIEAKLEFRSGIPMPQKISQRKEHSKSNTEEKASGVALYILEGAEAETPMRLLQSSGLFPIEKAKGRPAQNMQVKMEELEVA